METVDRDHAHSGLGNVFESVQVAAVFLDCKHIVRSFTPAAAKAFGISADSQGHSVSDVIKHIGIAGELHKDVQKVIDDGNIIERRVHQDDGYKHYLMRILPYRAHTHRIEGAILTFVDVTNVIEAESQHVLLVEELNHRVRNMLAIVGAMAQQTLAQSQEPKQFTTSFLGRIQSLARTYTLVSKKQWGQVGLYEIFRDELEPHDGSETKRIHLSGPAIYCRPQAALAFGLVVHELTTNARKHGVLSGTTGTLSVNWMIEGVEPSMSLTVRWIESGGPKVRKPSKTGLGTKLISGELHSKMKAAVEFDYDPAGLSVLVTMPFTEDKLSVLNAMRAAS